MAAGGTASIEYNVINSNYRVVTQRDAGWCSCLLLMAERTILWCDRQGQSDVTWCMRWRLLFAVLHGFAVTSCVSAAQPCWITESGFTVYVLHVKSAFSAIWAAWHSSWSGRWCDDDTDPFTWITNCDSVISHILCWHGWCEHAGLEWFRSVKKNWTIKRWTQILYYDPEGSCLNVFCSCFYLFIISMWISSFISNYDPFVSVNTCLLAGMLFATKISSKGKKMCLVDYFYNVFGNK